MLVDLYVVSTQWVSEPPGLARPCKCHVAVCGSALCRGGAQGGSNLSFQARCSPCSVLWQILPASHLPRDKWWPSTHSTHCLKIAIREFPTPGKSTQKIPFVRRAFQVRRISIKGKCPPRALRLPSHLQQQKPSGGREPGRREDGRLGRQYKPLV